MAHITGTVSIVELNNADAFFVGQGYVEMALAGYGAQVPRYDGVNLIGKVSIGLGCDEGGNFQVTVPGNDAIYPPGTYYVITIRDTNGDIIQCNAYQFLGENVYDLNHTDPYNPNQPPPALPPLLTNLLLEVDWSATPVFPGDVYAAYRIFLAGDVTSSTAPNTVQGNLYTYIIFQDSVGGHSFAWPANFLNATPINPAPNGLTVQTFVRGLVDLVAISPGTWL